jgi:phage shock protein PspC (stress-responsive transcriptional regulator)
MIDFKGKKLYRSRNDRVISGVCGGLGEYFHVNSNIIRFIFLASGFVLDGVNTLIYFILAGVIPEEKQTLKENDKSLHSRLFGFSGLVNILSRLNKQTSIKYQNKIKPNKLKRNIYSQEKKDVYSQNTRVELDGYETRSGINIDWRGKLMIVLIISVIGYFLWKLGLLNFLNF